MNEDDNKINLTFKTVKEKLDWQGNVIEDIKSYDYVWNNYDPKVFLESVIRNADLSDVPSLMPGKYATDFIQKLMNMQYGWEAHDELLKYKSIESVPFNGIKFVVYDRATDMMMKWVMES